MAHPEDAWSPHAGNRPPHAGDEPPHAGNHPPHAGDEPPDAGGALPDPEDELQRALDAAYRYLGRRDRTEAEVRQRLEQAGTVTAVVDEAITILKDQHVLDDDRYARLFVEDKRSLAQWGADRIRRTLSSRGIDRELIEQALSAEDLDNGGGELERAVELLSNRFPNPPRDRKERDRALGVMLRKGYDGEVALDALAAYARDPAAN